MGKSANGSPYLASKLRNCYKKRKGNIYMFSANLKTKSLNLCKLVRSEMDTSSYKLGSFLIRE